MLTVPCIVLIAAFICIVIGALGKCPIYVGEILLAIGGLLLCLPH